MKFPSFVTLSSSILALWKFTTPSNAFLHSPDHNHKYHHQRKIVSNQLQERKIAFLSTETTRTLSQLHVFFDDFEDFSFHNEDENSIHRKKEQSSSSSSSSKNSNEDLYASLRARKLDLEVSSRDLDFSTSVLQDEQAYYLENWKTAQCTSTQRLALDDWIRRIAIDKYPLTVCGTAGGHLYLADLQDGEELDCLMNVHTSRNADLREAPTEQMLEAIESLYGQYDGGGIIALSMKDDWIVSSGREGGAHLSRISGQEEQVFRGSRGGTSKQTKLSLNRMGRFSSLKDVIVTSMQFDTAGMLWVGGYNGSLYAFDYEEQDKKGLPSMISKSTPTVHTDFGAPIISLSINDELGCGIASTANGIVIFSLEDGEIVGKWNPFKNKARDEFARSSILLKDVSNSNLNDEETSPSWSIVCGGSKGSLFQRKLHLDSTGILSDIHPFLDQVSEDESVFPIKMRPNHVGSVVALSSPSPGLLVSGALDGSMRIWNYSEFDDSLDSFDDETIDAAEVEAQYDDVGGSDSRPQCLYALTGYKVWLGSIFTNERKLVSDGADNTIIVHSFENEEEVLFAEDEDDDEISFE